MAKIINNKKEFKLIALTPEECFQIGFGLKLGSHKELICDNCNKLITDYNEIYYVPVLNRVFCQECFINWYDKAINYPEDKSYENNKYAAIIAEFESNNIDVKHINMPF